MPPSGNIRRPRSGAPERPDLRDKAEKIHSEVFHHEEEDRPKPKQGSWWVRALAGFGLAVFCLAMSRVFKSDYMLMFGLSLCIGIVVIAVIRLIAVRRANR